MCLLCNTHKFRMYLSYGYTTHTTYGPCEIYIASSDLCVCSRSDVIKHCELGFYEKAEIKRMYLNRIFIPSSTYITVTKTTINNVTTTVLYNVLMLNYNYGYINFSNMLKEFRSSKSSTSIPCYFTLLFIPVCMLSPRLIFYINASMLTPVGYYILILNGFIALCAAFYLSMFNRERNTNYTIYISLRVAGLFILSLLYPNLLILGLIYWLNEHNNTINKLIGNCNSNQMEVDISYFILDRFKPLNASNKIDNNQQLILNLSHRVLNMSLIDRVMNGLNNNEQILIFQELHEKYSNCLFNCKLCDELKLTVNDAAVTKALRLKWLFKIFVLTMLSYMIVLYVGIYIVSSVSNTNINEYLLWRIWVFNILLILDVLFNIAVIYLVIRYYKMSQIFMQSYDHWLDPVSFEHICNNNMGQVYGMEFLFHFIFEYCYVMYLHTNNYLIYQTLYTLHSAECSGNSLVCILSDDILHILLSYLWHSHPNCHQIKVAEQRQMHKYQLYEYDAGKLKSIVNDVQNKLLLKLNELTIFLESGGNEIIGDNCNEELEEDGIGIYYFQQFKNPQILQKIGKIQKKNWPGQERVLFHKINSS